MTPSRFDLRFASFLAYCPRGDTRELKRSQDLVRQLKENRFVRVGGRDEAVTSLVARRLRERSPPFVDEFLGQDTALVPVPRSARRVVGALWPGQEIAESLHAEGFGMQVLPCLERTVAVQKAATSDPATRTKAREHFESLELHDPLALPVRVTLVDDIVTRGAQLFGAAWPIRVARPDIEVRAFAVIRTISAAEDFDAIAAPCTGRIEWRNEECFRRP